MVDFDKNIYGGGADEFIIKRMETHLTGTMWHSRLLSLTRGMNGVSRASSEAG